MPERILSRAVLSPAGSGKTERLARRYIELLQAGSPPERILTITFTEKAAAEMKERIFRILRKEDPALLRRLKSRVLKLRISTIHSFCFNLVQRFASELGLEPDLQALAAPEDLWFNTEYDLLMQIAEAKGHELNLPGSVSYPLTDSGLSPAPPENSDYSRLLELVTAGKMSGWNRLSGSFRDFFEQRTSIERAQVRPMDFERLAEIAQSLRTDPLGPQQIPNYAELFPERFDSASLLNARKNLSRVEGTFLTTTHTPRKRPPTSGSRLSAIGYQEWCTAMHEYWIQVQSAASHEEFRLMFDLFQRVFLAEYDRRKQQQGLVDFADMERLAYRLLTQSDEWSNILLAFDEHTDHILVDEFQDTSYLQWGIIEKLTEEWRSGEGRRSEMKTRPTIFIVGDDKQSIYLFRNAHAEVFTQAEQELKEWLGPKQFLSETVETNYRSLSRIIDFTNHVFSRLMNPAETEPAWCTRYSPFRRERKNNNPGKVELLLASDAVTNAAERRELEAGLIADRILSLHGQPVTYDDNEQPVPCDWKHVTILLRNRTHLQAYEQALARRRIPYLVQHGTGFYAEPETLLLKALLSVLVDPYDDLALYALLKSPLFAVPERELFWASTRPGNTLMDRLLNDQAESGRDYSLPTTDYSLLTTHYSLPAASRLLRQASGETNRRPLAGIMERVLTEQQAWSVLWEPQRRANVRKFLQLVEGFENEGMHPLRIKTLLDKLAEDKSEAKASIDVRGQNAVQIMTIHNAKGLQFPIVFVPMLDHDIAGRPKPLLIQEQSHDRVMVSYIANSAVRNQDPWFQEYWQREEEEEKRLFYVACTRARDALFLSGIVTDAPPRNQSWLNWLWGILALKFENQRFSMGAALDAVELLNPDDISRKAQAASHEPHAEAVSSQFAVRSSQSPVLAIEPIVEPLGLHIRPVTRDTLFDRKRHGDDAIAFGTVMHQVLERISLGKLDPADSKAVIALVRGHDPNCFSSDEGGGHDPNCFSSVSCPPAGPLTAEVLRQLELLRDSGLLDIVLPQPDSYAEMPFMLRQVRGHDPNLLGSGSCPLTVFNGRIDRLILRTDTVDVYDYKTFPVSEKELPDLVAEYRDSQMNTYLAAAAHLFPGKKPRGFLIFTALPRLVAL
jgi:ATP-dependent helicase/nuclease subunit A